MGRKIGDWDKPYIERLRRKSMCVGIPIHRIFTAKDKQDAIHKLLSFYAPKVESSFAERMLILSELYD